MELVTIVLSLDNMKSFLSLPLCILKMVSQFPWLLNNHCCPLPPVEKIEVPVRHGLGNGGGSFLYWGNSIVALVRVSFLPIHHFQSKS